MREMTLQDLHAFCLDIAKDVHLFCVSHGIRYSLAYGSLLGAVRHQGFIPWDDDIDIVMPRPDYDRFCSIYKSPNYKIVTAPDAYIAYARVFDNNKTYCRTLGRWLKNGHEGVFIDIFPMDAVQDDYEKFVSQRNRAKRILKMQLDNRGARKNLLDLFRILPLSEAIKSLKVTLHNRYFYKQETDLDLINKKFQDCLNENDWNVTHFCAVLAYVNDSISKQVPKEYWDDLILTDFEDTQFYIFKAYDSVLKDVYGDYMQIPSKEQREQHALAIARFYFK